MKRYSLPSTPRGSRSAFSLLELLVAVAVLAILAALLFPMLGRMRASADGVKCAHNLQTTGAAFLRYAAEHNGSFLPTKFWYSRVSTAESPGIRDYLGVDQTTKSTSTALHVDTVLTCPQLKALAPRKFGNMFNRCYSMNGFLISKSISQPDVPDAPDNPGSPKVMAAVPSLSRMWAFMDGTAADLTGGGEFGTVVTESHLSQGQVHYPHQARQNIVFLDGHVEGWSRGELLNPPSAREFWGDLRKP